jgi:hypothetical protein
MEMDGDERDSTWHVREVCVGARQEGGLCVRHERRGVRSCGDEHFEGANAQPATPVRAAWPVGRLVPSPEVSADRHEDDAARKLGLVSCGVAGSARLSGGARALQARVYVCRTRGMIWRADG